MNNSDHLLSDLSHLFSLPTTDSSLANRQWLNRLRQLFSKLSPLSGRLSKQWLTRLGHWLLASMTDSQQVRVWKSSTKAGTLWSAYDPATQRSIRHCSEAKLRAWLEERYRI